MDIEKISQLLPQERIHLNHKKRASLKGDIEKKETLLKNVLSSKHYEQMKVFHDKTMERESNVAKERQRRKFGRLSDKKANQEIASESFVDKNKWIINISNKEMSENEK